MAESDEWTQINIRVKAHKKEDWGTYAEENGFHAGLSGLIRTAVENFIENGATTTQPPTGQSAVAIPDDLQDRLATIEDTVTDVEQTVDRVDESVGFIEQKMVETDEPSTTDKFMRAIPPTEPETERWAHERSEYADTDIGGWVAWDGTIETITEKVGADEETVRDFLEGVLLREDIPVETAEIEGEERYWAPREYPRFKRADGEKTREETESLEYSRREAERQEGQD